ncbi:hypothetical protein AV530_019289 [Patagioenas fasciata monilis]|uniref:Uncharacterized protein n=1 Tax=Patagioenas fasciata monilis TaxID=372326 RepID=A0A1V4JCW5_PATFA|nr:hypothetical protein AV530_019289 [Patagioenas fasciata monilis]
MSGASNSSLFAGKPEVSGRADTSHAGCSCMLLSPVGQFCSSRTHGLDLLLMEPCSQAFSCVSVALSM